MTTDAPSAATFPADCPSRRLLKHVAGHWGVFVLLALEPGPLRWSEIRRTIEGISEKMLASTLRTFEQDGLVDRTVHGMTPPHVTYQLTTDGQELSARLHEVMDWIDGHVGRGDETARLQTRSLA